MSRVERAKVIVYERVTEAGRRRRAHRLYDERTFKIIDRVLRPDSNAVDVGCHEGLILRRMLTAAPNGRHFAFEPLPHLAARLRESFPTVQVHEVALSDAPGEASFVHVVSNPGYSGLRVRRYDRPDEDLARIDVKVDTLDHVLPDDVPITFIKIDVEGAELGVMRGARETIVRWKPHIVFEHGLGGSDYYGTRPEHVYGFLVDECGLRISLLERFLRGGRSLTAGEFVQQFESGANYYFVAHPAT
jgi:FkbM family methyltransferase